MTKLVTSSVLVLFLCAPALADAPSPTLQIGLTIAGGKDSRHYSLKLADHACGDVMSKAPQRADDIHACLKSEAAELRLELDWTTREGDRELRNRSTVVAARGQSFDLDCGGAKLTVTV